MNLREIWEQSKIPVVFAKDKLLVKLPYASNNRLWLSANRKKAPDWNKKFKCWKLPKSALNELIRRCLEKYSRVYLIQRYLKKEQCAPSCWNAKGFDCHCSCLGAHHGRGNHHGNWHEISETLALRWNGTDYASRLIVSLEAMGMAA